MSIALITEANPRAMSESHPSYLTQGRWRVVAPDVSSKLSVRRLSIDKTVETVHSIGDIFDGACLVIIMIVESSVNDQRISVHAERAA